jgi:hypothetical protein
MKTCIIPLSTERGDPLYDVDGYRVKCSKPVPVGRRLDRLCDEHYAPVSDDVIYQYIRKRLSGTPS